MSKHGIVIVQSDDWEGLYVDGKLVYENHSIKVWDLIREGILRAEVLDVSSDELERHGCQCPEKLKDLKLTR